ncbi:hypothetical protein RhiirA5_430284 [Rhizophagus irregularis]|uniref:Uncharacterized protein n=1 Tax=Rhizophagus irregularis TaxID=588596 RepID=A0A2I1EZW2_9GLOM|nr:hypothetical protein RhiirA5_430284 [Rhizophagus irregularis]PKC57512.1 hypothetical protein RhiirA1_472379 [Rhizophagus irregularis]PKY27659.1 hypothetical protein RhiirB3_443448 [Rhizophagus irregularis]
MEYNTLLTDKKVLREKWHQNWAKCDALMTEKEAKIFECAQLVTRNLANGESRKNEIVFREIKPPCVANNVINNALIKLGKFMKDSLDSLHEQNNLDVNLTGCQVELFGMDLAFDGLYHFKKIGRASLPTKDANFLNIVSVISNFNSLLEKADHLIEELNRLTTPTGQSYYRESNSSPHKVQIPVLKIPPPALSD